MHQGFYYILLNVKTVYRLHIIQILIFFTRLYEFWIHCTVSWFAEAIDRWLQNIVWSCSIPRHLSYLRSPSITLYWSKKLISEEKKRAEEERLKQEAKERKLAEEKRKHDELKRIEQEKLLESQRAAAARAAKFKPPKTKQTTAAGPGIVMKPRHPYWLSYILYYYYY